MNFKEALIAHFQGENVECKVENDSKWSDFIGCFGHIQIGNLISAEFSGWQFRLKPRTITVNGREIVAGESEAPADGKMYWTPVFLYSDLVDDYRWLSDDCDLSLLQKGLVHLTKENAIAHAKAMLGID